MLWFVTSAFWTAATLLRMHYANVNGTAWMDMMANQVVWISLLLPPLMFAVIIAAVRCVIRTHRAADQ